MNEIYERAIAAYQFQVDRYHTWMNYYSLFHGALLIALYTLFCNGYAVGEEVIPTVIPLLGYIAALCWLGTVIGNMAWMGSWIRIIQMIEANSTIEFRIYTLLHTNGSTRHFLSTQKIMRIFCIFVCLAWAVIACYRQDGVNFFSLGIILLLTLVAIFMYSCQCACIHSDLKGMDIR